MSARGVALGPHCMGLCVPGPRTAAHRSRDTVRLCQTKLVAGDFFCLSATEDVCQRVSEYSLLGTPIPYQARSFSILGECHTRERRPAAIFKGTHADRWPPAVPERGASRRVHARAMAHRIPGRHTCSRGRNAPQERSTSHRSSASDSRREGCQHAPRRGQSPARRRRSSGKGSDVLGPAAPAALPPSGTLCLHTL